nr:DUF4276 family protein [Candidatus Parabeggiatoa sp.]
MVRVGISVEGVTEERFIKISPHLAQQAIFVTPVSMGGNVSIDRVRYEINKLIYHFDVVTTFYDFYGFKRKQKRETKDSLEAQILESVPKAREKSFPIFRCMSLRACCFPRLRQ